MRWIAALAREYRWPVLIRDQRFAAVTGLRIRTWPDPPACRGQRLHS
jgi:predicted nucleic acid-binding protein